MKIKSFNWNTGFARKKGIIGVGIILTTVPQKELEEKVSVLAVEQNMTVCDATRKAVKEYMKRS